MDPSATTPPRPSLAVAPGRSPAKQRPARQGRSKWSLNYWYRRIVALRASPHQIAMGAAVGVFIGFTPTFGFQMLLAVVVAFLFRLSKPATVIPVWVSNPITFVPFYAATYAAGAIFWPGETLADLPATMKSIAQLGTWQDQLHAFWNLGTSLFGPLWIGAVVLGGPIAIATYPVVRRGVIAYRHHRAHVRHERRLRREAKRQATAG
ncbi:MAG: DUF2062 domain-containing protein [Planctomycetota bacterium]